MSVPDDIAELKAIIRTQQDQNARLEALVASFKKALFGSKSEKIDPAQYELELEDIETAIAQVEAEINADERTAPVRPTKPRQTNRGSLPKHLERVEAVIEPELSCGCGADRHVIGEDVSERLDVIPAQFRVIVTRRPKYACRSCEGRIAQAPDPSTSSQAACRLKPLWPMCSSLNMRITCRSIGRPRFTAARALIWIARPWLHGSANRRSN